MLPDYLDVSDIMVRRSENMIAPSPTGQWGERLSVGATRALTSDLQERLSGVLVTNTAPLDRPALQVIAELETFEPQADGTVILVARWRLVDTASHRVLASERVSLTELNSGATDSAMAAGMSRALADLSAHIAPGCAHRLGAEAWQVNAGSAFCQSGFPLYMWRGQLGEEVLNQMARRIKLSVIESRGGDWLDRGGFTAVLPAAASGSRTRASASDALSAMSVSASIVGSRWSAPTRSCASPPVRKKSIGLPSASTRAWILVLSPPRERPIAWSSPAFFGRRRYADGRAYWCCRSSRIRCRRLRRDVETSASRHRFGPTAEPSVDLRTHWVHRRFLLGCCDFSSRPRSRCAPIVNTTSSRSWPASICRAIREYVFQRIHFGFGGGGMSGPS